MKKTLIACLVLLAAYYAYQQPGSATRAGQAAAAANSELARAYAEHRTAYQTQGVGAVTRILSDDSDGSRHQRFILELPSGQTVLVAHNIDLAPRIAALTIGDTVAFFGEYEWNAQGGVIHWTHRDPRQEHVAGWLEHNGQRYQ